MNSFALLFPGQGSQYVGMGESFFNSHSELFNEAENALSLPLKSLMFDGPIEKLTKTSIAQPAILLHSIICFNEAQKFFKTLPVCALGHSLGEYSALVSAGVLSLTDTLKVVHARGCLMEDAVPEGHGGMAAILGMDYLSISEALKEFSNAPDYAAVANFNGPGQTVMAGTKSGLIKASAKLKSLGAKRIIDLPVSAPFHSALMKPVAEKLAEVLAKISFKDAQFPIISNVNAKAETKGEVLKELLLLQVASPVRFTDCVNFVKNNYQNEKYLELGPKNVLSGLTKKIDEQAILINVDTKDDFLKLRGLNE